MASSPGWLPDPSGRFEFRYHNGERWTRDVSSRGVRYVDRSPPERPKGTTAALVLGIVGVSIAWMPVFFVGAIVCGVLAIVWSVRGSKAVVDDGTRRVLRAGFATGVAALVSSGVGLWFSVILFRAVERYQQPEPHSVDIDACVNDSSGVITASGSLTNESTSPASFTIRLLVDGEEMTVETGSVRPGATEEFDVRRRMAATSPECRVVRVDGPLPLGLDIG